jgi:DNA-binding GntR family transcriptional regulator
MEQASITDLAKEYLEKAIFSGELPPGAQIKEDHIAEVLKISRPPLREAFKLLEGEGLVVRKPRRGVFVSEITDRDVWEIYSLKAELYEFSITLAFDRMKAKEVDQMGEIVEAMKSCAHSDSPDILAYQDLNVRFHDIHIDLAHHRRLKQGLWVLHKQVMHFSYNSLSKPKHLHRSLQYHFDIHAAFKDGDQEMAKQLTRDHVLAALSRFSIPDQSES